MEENRTSENKYCQAEVRKNIVLAEIGQPLTIPLARLNQDCDFKKKWDKIQKKWHGQYELDSEKEKVAKYNKEYNQRPEVKLKSKEYHQRPEIILKRREYHKKYYQRPEIILKQKEYCQKNKEKILARKKAKREAK